MFSPKTITVGKWQPKNISIKNKHAEAWEACLYTKFILPVWLVVTFMWERRKGFSQGGSQVSLSFVRATLAIVWPTFVPSLVNSHQLSLSFGKGLIFSKTTNCQILVVFEKICSCLFTPNCTWSPILTKVSILTGLQISTRTLYPREVPMAWLTRWAPDNEHQTSQDRCPRDQIKQVSLYIYRQPRGFR